MKTEQQTRVELIDKQLAKAGWDISDPTQVVQEYDIIVDLPEGVAEAQTPYQGHQFSDYVLLGKNGKPLAVVEAKKSSKETSLAFLGDEKERLALLKITVIKQISELPLSVDIVKREESLITLARQNYFWSTLTDDALDTLSEKLAPLMKFRQKDQEGSGPVMLDLKDKVKNREMVEFGPQNEAISISRYKEMVEKKDLIQSPFTVIHPQGIRGVFSPGEINEILFLTEHLAA